MNNKLKDFVLGTEIASIGEIEMANISMSIKGDDLTEGFDYIKAKSIVLLNKNSVKLPNNIRNIMKKYDEYFTDFTGMVPYIYLYDMLQSNTYINKIGKVTVIDDKKFITITDKKLESILLDDTKVKYVTTSEELKELINGNYIRGYIHMLGNKYLTWY